MTFIGPNGTGKSVLALFYIQQMASAIILDSKHEITLSGFTVTADPREMGRLARVIWRPDDTADPVETGDLAGWYAKKRKHTCLYLDEAALVAPGQKIGRHLRGAIITGRADGVGIYAATQRPKDVHNLFFSEAWAYFVSLLVTSFDREKILGFVGEDFLKHIHLAESMSYAFYAVRRGEKPGRIIRLEIKGGHPK